MRDVGGVVDFLEEYGLLRPPPSDGVGEPRVGEISADEEIVEVDWDAVKAPESNLLQQSDFTVDELSIDGLLILEELGRVRNGDTGGLEGRAIENPWETCAWYSPIHYFGHNWGIYIKQECLEQIASEIGWFGENLPRTARTVRQLRIAAFYVLFLHEHFHHKVESFGIRLALADRSAPDKYLRYDTDVYRRALGTDDLLEEALAGADAYGRLMSTPYATVLDSDVRTACRQWMSWHFEKVAPPGYRMAQRFLTTDLLSHGTALLQTQVLEAQLNPVTNPAHWKAGPHMLRSMFSIVSDIYLVIPAGSKPRFPVSSRKFTVKVTDTRKWLTKVAGFTLVSTSGDHEKYVRGGTHVTLDGTARELSFTVERSVAHALGVSQRRLREAVSQGLSV